MNSHKRWRMMSPQDGRLFEEDEHHQPMMENKGGGDRIDAKLEAKKSTILDSMLDILPHNSLPKIKRIGETREQCYFSSGNNYSFYFYSILSF